jgi:hypothetical protein
MSRQPPGEELVVRTIILEDASAAMRAVQRWATEKEAKVGAGVWMRWTDGLRSDDGRVGAVAVCKHRDELRSCRSFLGIGRIEDFDPELWAIGLRPEELIKIRDIVQRHGMKMVAVFSNSQAAIRWAAHLQPGTRQRLARRINQKAQVLHTHSIKTEIY